MYGHEAARLPRWRTREEAFTLHNNGQGAEAWLKQLGATAESMNFAQPGDIVIEPARRRKSPPPVMVHLGHGMLLTASPVLPRIVMYVRDRDVRRDAIAWRLPHG